MAYQHFCGAVFHCGIIASLRGDYVIVLLSYFELWYFFWVEAGGKKLMVYLIAPFPCVRLILITNNL